MPDLLELLNAVGLLKDAAGNRASPRPVVSGRVVIALVVVVAVSGMAYWSFYGQLGATSPRLRLVAGVIWAVGAAATVFLAGNQLDAALTRRRLAAMATRRHERKLARRRRRNRQNP